MCTAPTPIHRNPTHASFQSTQFRPPPPPPMLTPQHFQVSPVPSMLSIPSPPLPHQQSVASAEKAHPSDILNHHHHYPHSTPLMLSNNNHYQQHLQYHRPNLESVNRNANSSIPSHQRVSQVVAPQPQSHPPQPTQPVQTQTMAKAKNKMESYFDKNEVSFFSREMAAKYLTDLNGLTFLAKPGYEKNLIHSNLFTCLDKMFKRNDERGPEISCLQSDSSEKTLMPTKLDNKKLFRKFEETSRYFDADPSIDVDRAYHYHPPIHLGPAMSPYLPYKDSRNDHYDNYRHRYENNGSEASQLGDDDEARDDRWSFRDCTIAANSLSDLTLEPLSMQRYFDIGKVISTPFGLYLH